MSAKVFDELTCPECGGRIGLAGADAPPGVKPCTCFVEKPAPRRRLPDEPDPEDMIPLAKDGGSGDGASLLAPDGKKRCRVCNKDLTGRSRLKDAKGYMCKKCSDAEFEAEAEEEANAIECPECHRKLKADAFLEYRGTLICKRCHSGHLDDDKLKVAKLGELRLHNEQEKKSVVRLAIIGGVLALALIIKTFIIGW